MADVGSSFVIFVDFLSLLFLRGAKVDAIGQDGHTPLHFASQEGHLDVVNLLLEHDASVTQRDHNSFTAKDIALKNGHKTVRPRKTLIIINAWMMPHLARVLKY